MGRHAAATLWPHFNERLATAAPPPGHLNYQNREAGVKPVRGA